MANIASADEARIRELVGAYCAAVHAQDEAEFEQLWSAQGNNTLVSITKAYVGTAAIVHDFLDVLRSAYSSIELVADELSLRALGENVALATFRYHTVCTRREDGSPYGIAGIETQVFVKERGQWKLAHIHYSK